MTERAAQRAALSVLSVLLNFVAGTPHSIDIFPNVWYAILGMKSIPTTSKEAFPVKKYLMRWLWSFALYCMSTFWMVIFMNGTGGESYVLFLICLFVHLISFGLCVHAGVAGQLAAEREKKRQKQREEEQRGAPSVNP